MSYGLMFLCTSHLHIPLNYLCKVNIFFLILIFFYYITDIDMLESKCQVFDSGMDKKVDKEGVGLGAEAGVGEGVEDGLGEVLYAAAAPSRIVMHFPSELQ